MCEGGKYDFEEGIEMRGWQKEKGMLRTMEKWTKNENDLKKTTQTQTLEGEGRLTPPKNGDILGLWSKGWLGIENVWSGASEKERKNCTFRLGAEREHRRKMVVASKSPKGMGLWFVLPREWQWHTHTQTQSQGQVSRFYSMSAWLGLSTEKALLPRKHTPIKPTKHNFTCLLSVRAVKWKQVRKQYNIVLKTPQ